MLTDLQAAVRSLIRHPARTFALLVTIALGVGANAVVFGLIDGLQGSSFPGVVSILFQDPASQTAAAYRKLRSSPEAVAAFEWIGAAHVTDRMVTTGKRTEMVTVASLTPELSHWFAQRQFPSDRPIGRWTTFNDQAPGKIWILGQLRPGISPDQVHLPDCDLIPYRGKLPEQTIAIGRISTLLQAAAFLVLFIAGANVVSFQLSAAAQRKHETAIRIAIGASRAHLARGVLADSLVVAILGGALGAVLATWTLSILPALLFEDDAASLLHTPDTVTTLLWSGGAVLLITALGLLPAIETSQIRPATVLRRERIGVSPQGRGLRALLVAAQMASSVLLVVATGYLHQGFRASMFSTAGRTLRQPILASVETSATAGLHYFEDTLQAATAIPGVVLRGWTARLPGGHAAWRSFRIEPQGLPARNLTLSVLPFASQTLDHFRLPLIAGRLFGRSDRGCLTAVANQAAAHRLFGDTTVGRSLLDAAGRPVTIIGIAADSRPPALYFDATHEPAGETHISIFRTAVSSHLPVAELSANVVTSDYLATAGYSVLHGSTFPTDPSSGLCRVAVVNREASDLYFGGHATGAAVIDETGRRTSIIGVIQGAALGSMQRSAPPEIYFPMEQDYEPTMTMLLESLSAAEVTAPLQAALDKVPGRGPQPPRVRTLETYLYQTGLAPLRVAIVLLAASVFMALLLSGLGLSESLRDMARRHRREIGIRLALGARRRHIFTWTLRYTAVQTSVGIALGLAASMWLPQFLSGIPPAAPPPAAWIWIAGPAALSALVLIASVRSTLRSMAADSLRG